MNGSPLKLKYENEGFLVVREFLPSDELEQLQRHLVRYIQDVVPHVPASDAFYDDPSRPETLKQMQRLEQDPYFAEYRTNSRWRTLAETLLGEVAEPHGAEWFNKPPGTHHETPPHQDNYYFCLAPPQVLTMWLALDVVDDENGCLRYIPGSHRLGIRPHQRTRTLGFSQGISDYSDEDRAREVAMHVQPGDLLIHHGNTIHRADANRSSTRHRRSFAMVFQAHSCRRDETAFAQYKQAAARQHQELGLPS